MFSETNHTQILANLKNVLECSSEMFPDSTSTTSPLFEIKLELLEMEPQFKPRLEKAKRVSILPPRSGTHVRATPEPTPPALGQSQPLTFAEIISELVEDVLNISTLVPRIKEMETEVRFFGRCFSFEKSRL